MSRSCKSTRNDGRSSTKTRIDEPNDEKKNEKLSRTEAERGAGTYEDNKLNRIKTTR